MPELKLPPVDKIAFEMYEAAARSRADEKKRGYLGMSEIGHPCERKLWFSFRGFTPKPMEGRSIMIFRFGDHVEADVIDWLRAAGYRIEGQQEPFLDHDRWFAGHCDGIIHEVTKRPHILEVKSAKDKKFKAFKSFGVLQTSETYYCQAQCYMGYAGLERALFVIQNKDTCEIYTERVYFDTALFDSLKAKARRIITANEPLPPEFLSDSFECTWCDHRTICWEPEMALNNHIDCMTCSSMAWIGLTRWCRNPAHSFEIMQRVGACPDWKGKI